MSTPKRVRGRVVTLGGGEAVTGKGRWRAAGVVRRF